MGKVYTRTGDRGDTNVMGVAEKVSKASPRIEALGDVDELNSMIGMALARQTEPRVIDALRSVQNVLFTVGAELGTAPDATVAIPRVTANRTADLERIMGEMDPGEVKEFVMPRGSEAVASLHVARAVARRAERRCVALAELERVNPELLRYMNRLSSLLYTLAVWLQRHEGRSQEHPTY